MSRSSVRESDTYAISGDAVQHHLQHLPDLNITVVINLDNFGLGVSVQLQNTRNKTNEEITRKRITNT